MINFYVDDDGIYAENVKYGKDTAALVIPKETFIEAFRKYILENNLSIFMEIDLND